MKRLISFLLVFVLLLGMMPAVMAASPFSDVPGDAYYYDAVLWAVEKNITTGTGGGKFSPLMNCTRAQVVTFLWRAAGSPEPTATEMSFTDVPADAYYYDAVLWAVENNITTGTGNGKFSPLMDCSRAQIVTFLWRSQGSPAVSGVANPFKDVPAGQYYTDAVLWAVKEGITTGTAADKFSPDMICTRSQIVTFLYRCLGISGLNSNLIIVENAKHAQAAVGDTAAFCFVFDGGAEPYTYQWEYKDPQMDDYVPVPDTMAKGIDTSKMTVEVTEDILQGRYVFRCTGTDGNGDSILSSEVIIVEELKLQVRYHPSPARDLPGETVNLSAEVTGGVPPYKVTWESNSQGRFSDISDAVTSYQGEDYPVSMDYDAEAGYADCWITISDLNSWETNEEIRCKFEDSTGAVVYTNAVNIYKGKPMSWFTYPKSVTYSGQSYLRYEAEIQGGQYPYEMVWERYYHGEWEPIKIDLVNARTQSDENYGITMLDVFVNENTAPWLFEGYYGGIRCVCYDANGIRYESGRAYALVEEELAIELLTEDDIVTEPESPIATVKVDAAGGVDPYSYEWRYWGGKNNTYRWIPLEADDGASYLDGGATLVLDAQKNTECKDGMFVSCMVTDLAGSTVYSETANVTYVDEFSFYKAPESVTALVGEDVSLTAKAAGGKKPYSYTWQYRETDDKDAKWQPVSENAGIYQSGVNSEELKLNMRFDKPEYDFCYEYRCVVTDASGKTIETEPVQINAGDLLHLEVDTDHAFAGLGDDVTFSVKPAGGKEPYTYQWYWINKTQDEWVRCVYDSDAVSGIYTPALRVDPTQYFLDNNYEFYCKVTDANGDSYSSSAAMLRPKLHITKQPGKFVETEVDAKFTFTVEAEGGREPYSYQWLIGDRPIEDNAKAMECVEGATITNTLTIKGGWSVRCLITDANGDRVISEAGRIFDGLKDEPKRGIVYESPENVFADVGDIVEFTMKCDSKYAKYENWGYASSWLYPNDYQGYTTIGNQDWVVGYENDGDTRTIRIRVEEWMLQQQVQFRGTGLATYVGGEGQRWAMHYNNYPCHSANARIISPEHPYFTQNPMRQTASPGEYATFDVQVGGGDGPYTVTWQRSVPSSDEYDYNSYIAIENGTWVDLSSYTLDGWKTSYQIKATSDTKSMVLRCVITDKNGKTVESYPTEYIQTR